MSDSSAHADASKAVSFPTRVSRPTLRDVAAEAGVSIQTVSNVINGRLGEMSRETQERVRMSMFALDYQVDRRAASLRSGLTKTIAVLVLDEHAAFLADPLTAMVIAGVGDVARDNDYAVLIQGSKPSARSSQLLTPLREGRADGAVVQLSGPPEFRRSQLAQMVEQGLPIVAMDELEAEGTVAAVRADQVGGARKLAEHLISLGHRRIAFIGAAVPWAVVEQRADGYREALRAAGIPFKDDLFLLEAEGYDPQQGARLTSRLLALPNPPTAIMCASDLLALGALEALRAIGAQAPKDVAITGFDDFSFAAHVDPSLTTVRIPGYEMGRRAAEALLAAISGNLVEQESVFPTQLIERRSA